MTLTITLPKKSRRKPLPLLPRSWLKRTPALPTILMILIMTIAPLPALPQSATQSLSGTVSTWELSADHATIHEFEQEYIAEGNVLITNRAEGRSLQADHVRYNLRTGEAEATGRVRLVAGQDVLTGERLSMNLETQTGVLVRGKLFMAQNHLYLTGQEIRKTGPQSYSAAQAEITSCDGEKPDWHITGKDLKITLEGYGVARNAAFWANGVPVMYTPYLAFPAKSKRQSGLLAPELGYSDRKGSEYLQPLYWAINESSDATFYEHYMSLRGLRTGAEYRYALGDDSLGTIMLDLFEDRQVDDGLNNNTEKWGYNDDALLRPNEDRYWLRAKADQELPWNMRAKLDLDWVSDQDYLTEFRSPLNGFLASKDSFLRTFGRDLDDYNDPVRLNRLNINRIWPYYTFNASLLWNDDVIKRTQADRNDTLQRLPSITLDGLKQPLNESFFYSLSSGLVYFYREDGTRGQRLDLHPRAYYLLAMPLGITLEPSVGLRGTAWNVEPDGGEEIAGDEIDTRTLYDFRMAAATDLFRIYDFSMAGADRLKHSAVPEISYTYIPDEDQEDLPKFDLQDRIKRQNLITYSLTNIFTARRPLPAAPANGPQFDYSGFMRFKLLQSFDINEHNEDDPEPFSSIRAELTLTPGQLLSLDADTAWSPYDGRFDRHTFQLSLWNARGDRLEMGYHYTSDEEELEDLESIAEEVESIRVAARLVINSRWSTRAEYERNLLTEENIETGIGLSYKAQCWGLDFHYANETGDNRYSAVVHLLNLGSFGN